MVSHVNEPTVFFDSCCAPDWRNGRRGALKMLCSKGRASSSLASGTTENRGGRRCGQRQSGNYKPAADGCTAPRSPPDGARRFTPERRFARHTSRLAREPAPPFCASSARMTWGGGGQPCHRPKSLSPGPAAMARPAPVSGNDEGPGSQTARPFAVVRRDAAIRRPRTPVPRRSSRRPRGARVGRS